MLLLRQRNPSLKLDPPMLPHLLRHRPLQRLRPPTHLLPRPPLPRRARQIPHHEALEPLHIRPLRHELLHRHDVYAALVEACLVAYVLQLAFL